MDQPPEARLLLPGHETALIIGKGGATLRKIRDASGASLRVIEKELPDSFRIRDERVLCLGGNGEELKAALKGMNEIIQLDHLCCLVPEAAVPHLIGTKGERIKQLIQSSGCDLQIGKQPMQGVHATRRLTIVAKEGMLWDGLREVNQVCADLQKSGFLDPKHFELLDDSLPDAPKWVDGTPLRFLADEEETCWIVGKKGNKVSKYRDICKLSVDDAPPCFDNSVRCVTLDHAKGPDAQKTVLQLMLDDLGVRLEPTTRTRLLVPSEVAGKVIGRGEENIREIERGAKVVITAPMPPQYQAERVFNIDGNEGGRVEAVMKIQALIQEHQDRKKNASINAASSLNWTSGSNRSWSTPDTSKGGNNFFTSNNRSSGGMNNGFGMNHHPSTSFGSTSNGTPNPEISSMINTSNGTSMNTGNNGNSLYANPTGRWNPPASEEQKNGASQEVESWTRGSVGQKPNGIASATNISWTTSSSNNQSNSNSNSNSNYLSGNMNSASTGPSMERSFFSSNNNNNQNGMTSGSMTKENETLHTASKINWTSSTTSGASSVHNDEWTVPRASEWVAPMAELSKQSNHDDNHNGHTGGDSGQQSTITPGASSGGFTRTQPPKVSQRQPMLNWSSAVPRNNGANNRVFSSSVGAHDQNNNPPQVFSSSAQVHDNSVRRAFSSSDQAHGGEDVNAMRQDGTPGGNHHASAPSSGGFGAVPPPPPPPVLPHTNGFSSNHETQLQQQQQQQKPSQASSWVPPTSSSFTVASPMGHAPIQRSVSSSTQFDNGPPTGNNWSSAHPGHTTRAVSKALVDGNMRGGGGGGGGSEDGSCSSPYTSVGPKNPGRGYTGMPRFTLKILLPPKKLTEVNESRTALEQRFQISLNLAPNGVFVNGTTIANSLFALHIQQ